MAKYRPLRKLAKTSSHREAMLRNLTTSLLRYEQIRTTNAKAKELVRYAGKVISRARKSDLSSRREVYRVIKDQEIRQKLFDVLVPRYTERSSGFFRVFKLGPRVSDNAPMCLVKLLA